MDKLFWGGFGLAFDPRLRGPFLPARAGDPWPLSPSHHGGTAGGRVGSDGPPVSPPKLPSMEGTCTEPKDRNSPIFLHGLPELPIAGLSLPPSFLSLPIPFPALRRGYLRTPCLIHGSCRQTEPVPAAGVPDGPGGAGSATSRVAGELCRLRVRSLGKASLGGGGGFQTSPCSPSLDNNTKPSRS